MRAAAMAVVVAGLGMGCGLPELPDVAQPCGEWPEPGTYKFTVEVDGRTRKAEVYVPPTAGPRDLVVALHGGSSNADSFRAVTRLDQHALRENFVAVFPQGRKALLWRAWNAGYCCGNLDEQHRDANDVAFLDKLVKELTPRVCGDRVLAVGFSNGGMMANRWGCEGSEPDAIVAAAGPLLRSACEGEPRPFRQYHGLADRNVPFAGGEGKTGLTNFPPAIQGFESWKERNGCVDEDPEVFTFGPMTCERYPCKASTEQCTIQGWSHAWPGGRNAARLGSDATTDMLDFLHQHVPPGGTAATTEVPGDDIDGDTGAGR